MAFRARHKTQQGTLPLEPSSAAENEGTAPTPSVMPERTPIERKRRTRTATSSDEKLPSNVVPRLPRLAFVDQLRKQQPESAMGYRLVLPARSPVDTPKIVPVPDSQGGIRYWRLSPFELPDDIRLQDGLSYRVLWVDAAGQPLAPTTPYLPRLYFFLGPPDSEQDERNAAYDAIWRDVRDPAVRQSIEAEVARSRLALQRQREREAIRQQQTEREEVLYRIHTQQIEDDRLRRREDRSKQERQLDKEKAELKRQQAEQEAKNEREMWTAFKVIGEIAAAAALGWGPFTKWLDSLPKQPDAGQELGLLLQKVETLLSAQQLAASQTQTGPHNDGGTSEQTAQPTASPAANDPSADSRSAAMPTVSPAAEHRPVDTASAVAEVQHTQQAETAATPNPVASPSPQQSASAPVASSLPRQTSSEPPALDESLSEAQIQTVCGIVLDPERMALAVYENECVKARLRGTPPPTEPSLDLSPTERKEVRAVLSSPILLDALLTLHARFQATAVGGGEAMFALPSPFQSLEPQDRERIQHTLETPEQRDYFLFQIQRREARLKGLPMPPARPTQVPDKEQKAIRRLFRDERVMRYLCTSGVLSSLGTK